MTKSINLREIERSLEIGKEKQIHLDDANYGFDRKVWDTWEYRQVLALIALVREARTALLDYQERHQAAGPDFADCPCGACIKAESWLVKARDDEAGG